MAGFEVTITTSTITDNEGVGSTIRSFTKITVSNSIIAGNMPEVSAPALTVNYSLIGTGVTPDPGTSGNNVVSDTPMLGALADNGGPTETHLPLAGSPAIDMGDPAFTAPPDYDQRGFAFSRVVGGRIDIGAVESGGVSADFDLSGFVTGFDFLAWQRGFGKTGTVVHGDGDANIDGNVDDFDLTVWESQFGMAAPTVAAAFDSTPALPIEERQWLVGHPSEERQQTQRLLLSSDLVDVALAVELASDMTDDQETAEVDRPTSAEVTSVAAFATDSIAPAGLDADGVDATKTSSREVDEFKAQWLTDELLERVFG